jgi:hypothetical protein
VSANARVALAARRRKSGDVAIRWNSGNPKEYVHYLIRSRNVGVYPAGKYGGIP